MKKINKDKILSYGKEKQKQLLEGMNKMRKEVEKRTDSLAKNLKSKQLKMNVDSTKVKIKKITGDLKQEASRLKKIEKEYRSALVAEMKAKVAEKKAADAKRAATKKAAEVKRAAAKKAAEAKRASAQKAADAKRAAAQKAADAKRAAAQKAAAKKATEAKKTATKKAAGAKKATQPKKTTPTARKSSTKKK